MLPASILRDGRGCAPWCVEHIGGMCSSERRWADRAYSRLARLLDGQVTVVVSVPDSGKCGRPGYLQVSGHEARNLADVLRALGHAELCKVVNFTAHEADAFSQF